MDEIRVAGKHRPPYTGVSELKHYHSAPTVPAGTTTSPARVNIAGRVKQFVLKLSEYISLNYFKHGSTSINKVCEGTDRS